MLALRRRIRRFFASVGTFLTLIIALGGIATGIGAIWTAMLARRQLDEQRRFLGEQNEIARSQAQLTERSLAEQNERVRLNLEVDLLLRLEDRFDGPHMLAIRRRAARYIKDTFFSDGSLREVHTLNHDVWEVLNFYEDLGYFVTIGAVRPYTAWRSFGMGSFAYWALSKPAIAEERERTKEPNLYQDWERLTNRLVELARRSGEEFKGEFTEEELLEFIEEQRFAGEEPPTKE
jgi:hypothetical protein